MTQKCKHFPECGGCTLQHIPYELTLENKRKFLSDQLKRNKIDLNCEIEVIYTKEYNYRNRMDFVFFPQGLGLRKKDSPSTIIKVDNCEIASEKINLLKLEVEEFFHRAQLEPFNLRNHQGTMKYALIRACEFTDDSCISFALNDESRNLALHIDHIKEFAKSTSAKNVMISRVPTRKDDSISSEYFCVKGSEFLTENFLGKKMIYHSQGFFQNNPATAELMVKRAKTLLSESDMNSRNLNSETNDAHGNGVTKDAHTKDGADTKDANTTHIDTKDYTLLDLYGGVGTFGICLADMFKKTVIIESVNESIECANMNIKENNTLNTTAIVLDSAKMNKVISKGKLMVVNDPPRSGMTKQAIDNLMSLDADKIIYVSCNPAQFAREMILFQKKYEIKSLAIFDMFPQTNHIESMAELVLKK